MNQPTRILKLVELLSSGRGFTVNDIYQYHNGEITKRSLQRDFKILEQSDIPMEVNKRKNNEYEWQFTRDYVGMLKPIFNENHLFSLYILKSYLKTFKGTSIEKSIYDLILIIEKKAPGDIFIDFDSMLINQDSGSLDYSKQKVILQKIIKFIAEEKWVNITYQNLSNHKTKEYKTFLQKLFLYNNTIYVIAYYKKYDEHHALAIHRILEITESDQNDLIPDFNKDEFSMNRFGVFSGKIEHVVLEIQQEYVKWFENRIWHPSQIIKKINGEKLLIEMDVPLSKDFITWILGWHDGIKVLKPESLIDKIRQKLLNNLKIYEK